jgi:hypothetical protein
MSDLSSAYSEYEKVSGLFRQLNEAALLARQVQLGLDYPSAAEQELARDQLVEALDQLTNCAGNEEDLCLAEGISFKDVCEQAQDQRPVSRATVSAIRGRIGNGLAKLTNEDLETIEQITIMLDSASELLFRRIQK